MQSRYILEGLINGSRGVIKEFTPVAKENGGGIPV